ncbi:MAG: Na+/H+ antiporter subunit E [Ilumatobacteraceae bacterium]
MIARTLVLIAIWVALWGELSVANVASGVVVAVLVTVPFEARRSAAHTVHPVALLRLVGSVLVDLITSSWAVVVAVLQPRPDRIHTEIIPVQLATRSPLVASIVANAITLTPGTMSIACGSETFVLRVHVLGRVDHDTFAASVHDLERRVAAAITVREPA